VFVLFYVLCSFYVLSLLAMCMYRVVLYVFCAYLSRLNKDYLLTYLLTAVTVTDWTWTQKRWL